MRTRQGLWAAAVVAALLTVAPAAVAQPNATAATQTPTSTAPETTVGPTEPNPDNPCNEGASVCPTNPCDADGSTCPTEPCDPEASVCPTGPCEDYSCYAEPRLLVPDAVERGSSLTVSGDGWPCRIVEIAADWLSEPVVAVASEGSFAATIAVGDDVALGEHGVTAAQQGECDRSRSAGVVVLPAVTTEPPPPPPPPPRQPSPQPPTTTSAVIVPPVVEPATVATVEPTTTTPAASSAAPGPTRVPDQQATAWHVPLWLYLLLGAGVLAAIHRVRHRARPPTPPTPDVDLVAHPDQDPRIRVEGSDDTTLSIRISAHAGPTVTNLHQE